ncbi:MAG: GAF domain-containing protein [Candidatus Blackburnbacteria bacterium]|nr:GAF domain-containing protein [Candidatus Blackburnbacteria bacterium]
MTTSNKIYGSVLKFLVPLTPEQTFATIVQEAIKLAQGEHGSILIETQGKLKRVYSTYPVLFKNEPRKGGIRYEVFTSRQARILGAKQIQQVKERHPSLRSIHNRAAIILPLVYQDTSLGILSVIALHNENFKRRELDVLKIFSSFATLAIQKAQLQTQTEKALRTRDFFISLASHELRTPLTTINSYTQLLYKRLQNENATETKWVQELRWEVGRLTRLVNDLLTVSSVQTGEIQYRMQLSDLPEIVSRAVNSAGLSHPQHKFSVKNELFGKETVFWGDPEKIFQVLTNVLNNAAKFSPTSQKINTTIDYVNNNFIVKIQDKGKGIGKNDLPHIFDGFYKGKGNYRGGMGLGLFLAKSIIDKHKGKIKVASLIDKGTTVTINLPKVKI